VNNPEEINNPLAHVAPLDDQGTQPVAELTEIQNAELEHVAGGGGGTAVGWS
jgi:hypothetical protein